MWTIVLLLWVVAGVLLVVKPNLPWVADEHWNTWAKRWIAVTFFVLALLLVINLV